MPARQTACSAGFAALAINTRQHDDKRNTDNFFDVGRDIDAAVRTVRSLGYRSIVLQGHSLGTIQVLFCAATHWEHDIKALVQLSPLGDLAWRSRYLQVQEEAKYRALSEAALRAAPTLPTGIKRVPRPILMVRDDGDTIVTPFDPHVLLAAATSPGSLVPSIKFIPLPDPKGPNPGGHVFADNAKPLAEAITSWLGSRQLQWEPGLDRDASTCARAHIDRVQYRGAHGRT